MAEANQEVKVVARRTGLSPDAIRICEKCQGAVKPERAGTNRRLSSDEQIERLSQLRDIKQAGHGIGHIAKLPTETHCTNGHPSRSRFAGPAVPAANTFLDKWVADVRRALTNLETGRVETAWSEAKGSCRPRARRSLVSSPGWGGETGCLRMNWA